MAKKIYTNLDLQGNNLVNAVFENLSVVPASPKEGQIYFDVGDKKDKIFDGTKWIDRATTQELNSGLDKKVDKVVGKQLSTNDFTDDYKSQVDLNTQNRHNHSNKAVLDGTQESFTTVLKSKLDGVATGAQVNVIETVEVNGTAQPVTSKTIDISVPTKTSELQNDSDFATNASLTSGLNTKVDKVTGKQLSTNDFTNDYKSKVDSNTSARHTHSNKSVLDATTASFTTSDESKLNGIASGAQVNVIESIKVNGAAQAISAKSVNITVPTKTSQLQNDSEFVTLSDLDDSEAGIIEGLAGKVDKIEGKGLSTNDFTNDYKSKVDANTTARHTHSNKAILDATTASFTTAINNTINSKANASEVVKLTGNQTIGGSKTFSSAVTFPNKVLNIFGDDVSMGDNNEAGCISIKGLNGASGIKFEPYSGSTSQKISINGSGTMTITGTVASTFSGNLNGTASKAIADGNGNNIAATYATKAEIGGSSVKKQTYKNPALTPSGGVVTWTVTHTLNSQDVCATLRRVSDNAQIFAEIVFASATQVVVKMNADANVAANAYKLVLIG